MKTIQLQGLAFLGPSCTPISISFRPGLNVICGASETGKSFIVEAIDFMLGGRPPLRDIPERVGFDRIRMPIVCEGWEPLGLERSTEGGNFSVFAEELLEGAPTTEPTLLRQQHSPAREDTLSHVLLDRIGLNSKRVRKNRAGDTSSLSFRNLARLCVVTEEEIQRTGSPLLSGQYAQQTVDYSVFKLLVTGIDDSALVPSADFTTKRKLVEGKLELLDQMMEKLESELIEQGLDQTEILSRSQRIESEIRQQDKALDEVQAHLDALLEQRGEVVREIESRRARMTEIDELSSRFELLNTHYQSDLKRLEAIHESGSLFVHLERDACPLCGASLSNQHLETECDGNAVELIVAADAEMKKVRQLARELGQTVSVLKEEAEEIRGKLPTLEDKYNRLDSRLSKISGPAVTSQRASYGELVSKRAELMGSFEKFAQLENLAKQRSGLESEKEARDETSESRTEVATSTLDAFSQTIEGILSDWHFPNAGRVYFDESARDIQIAGKERGSTGKGLRAITHAAMTVGLVEFCLEQQRPHPGFVVLDSPLLAYWKPEGEEDDLSGTDLKDRFYKYLLGFRSDVQVIIVENEPPPAFVSEKGNVVTFTKNPHRGRYGFFPNR